MGCRPTKSRGFTLIELLVVIAVIVILAAFLFPVLTQARDKARQAVCLSNLKHIATAIALYRQDWDGYGPFAGWPPGLNWHGSLQAPSSHYELEWQFTIQPYLTNIGVLRCPSDPTPFEERPVSYVFNAMMSRLRVPLQEGAIERPAEVVTLWDGYGPLYSATMKNPPPINGQLLPPNMYREYTSGGHQVQWLVDPQLGLPRHNRGGHAIYMDLHARWVRYGVDNDSAGQAERLAAVERAFPFPTAVAPLPQFAKDKWGW